MDIEQTKKTICTLRWGYPIVNFGRNEIRTCCRTPAQTVTDEDIKKYGTDLILNTDYQKERRLELLQGVKHSDCQTCWNLEDSGMISPRLGGPKEIKDYWSGNLPTENQPHDLWKVTIDDVVRNVHDTTARVLESSTPFILELALGNTCDLKCGYCTHHYSTQWAQEKIKFGEISQESYDREFPQANPNLETVFWEWYYETGRHSVDRLTIIGGEPLIMPQFYDTMDKLLLAHKDLNRKKPITISIVSNMNTPQLYFTKFLNWLDTLTEYADKFQVELNVSMESTNERAEYIRFGLKWNRFEQNIHTILSKKLDYVRFNFMPAINTLCISTHLDFLKWVFELYNQHNFPIGLRQNVVQFPIQCNPQILTPNFSKYLFDCVSFLTSVEDQVVEMNYDKWVAWPQYTRFIKSLADSIATGNQTDGQIQFYRFYKRHDLRRNVSLVNIFPEYKEFYEHCHLQYLIKTGKE